MTARFDLDEFQSRAFQLARPGTILTLPWGRGSGKTYLGRVCIHAPALERPGIHVGLLMPSLKQARQVFWPGLLEDYEGPLRRHLRRPANRTLLEVTYANGSRLTTWGAENAGAIRGQRFDVLVEDETDDIDPDVEQAVVRPTFSRVGVNALWVKFGTPRRGRRGSLYGSYKKAQEGAPGYAGFRVRSSESPQVDQDWLRSVHGDTPPDIYSREYDCDFDAAGGRIYGDVFDESFHVRDAPKGIRWTDIIIGADHGWEHPGALLLIGIQGKRRDGVAYVLDEIYERHRTEDWWVKQLKRWLGWYPGTKLYGDPSQPSRLEAFRAAGARVQEVDNSLDEGIAAVANRFLVRDRRNDKGDVVERYAKLYIAPRCVNLLTELGCTVREVEGRKPLDGVGVYMRKRDPHNETRYLEAIDKRNDDANDALRYPIFNYFGGPERARLGVPHEALG